MMDTKQIQTDEDRLASWSSELSKIVCTTKNLTIGLCSGNRFNNDARIVYRILKSLQAATAEVAPEANMLLCRLDARQTSPWDLVCSRDEQVAEPKLEKSALGNWDCVDVPITVGNVATRSLQQVPRWLPKWKLRYNLIVVDLGPMHLVPSRIIGRLCDGSYVILGPDSCASAQWISQYVSHHEECGAHIAGTIVAAAA